MITRRLLAALICAFAVLTSSALGDPSCCVKAKALGKNCEKKCCLEAHKARKTCPQCQKEPSCCDKALALGKDCAHKCCVQAAKEKKVCDKCNPQAAPKK